MTEIGKEYGAALFLLAREEAATEEYADALTLMKTAFSDDPEYVELLASPSIPLGERLAVVTAAFAGNVPAHMLSYVQLLCEKGRMACFFEAAEEYFALLAASKRISTAKVTSAAPLIEDEKQKLISKLEAIAGGTVRMEYGVDESLFGGLVVEMDGKVLDGSLRHRLREIKEVMNT